MALSQYVTPINFIAKHLDTITHRSIKTLADDSVPPHKKALVWCAILGVVAFAYVMQIPDLVPGVGSIDNTVIILAIVGVVIEKIKRYGDEFPKIAGFFQGVITLCASAYGLSPVDFIPDALPAGFVDDLGIACFALMPVIAVIIWRELFKLRRNQREGKRQAAQPTAASNGVS